MKNLHLAAMGLFLFLLYGCGANNYPVRFVSNPPGAMVVCYGESMGYTPLQKFHDRNIGGDTVDLNMCSANWMSGASARYQGTVHKKDFPNGITATVDRPKKAPGLKEDNLFALQVMQMQQQQAYQAASIAAQESAAMAAMSSALALGNINTTLQNTNMVNQVNQNNMNLRNYNRGW